MIMFANIFEFGACGKACNPGAVPSAGRLCGLILALAVAANVPAQSQAPELSLDGDATSVRIAARATPLATVLTKLAQHSDFDLTWHGAEITDTVNVNSTTSLELLLRRILRHYPHTLEFRTERNRRKISALTLMSVKSTNAPGASPADAAMEAMQADSVHSASGLPALGQTTMLLNRRATPGMVARTNDHLATADLIADAHTVAMKPWESKRREEERQVRLDAELGAELEQPASRAHVADQYHTAPAPLDINANPQFAALQRKLAPLARSARRDVQALAASLRDAEAALLY